MSIQPPRVLALLVLLCCYFVNGQIPSSGCTLKTPVPTTNICGKVGSSPKYVGTTAPVLAFQTLSSLTDCQNLCLRRAASGDASCVNFSYDSSSMLCTITPETLKSISTNATSTVTFYERACFKCPQACSAQKVIGQDLLDNSGFEYPTNIGPWFSPGGTAQGIYNGGSASNQSYFCTASRNCNVQQSFSNCPTAVYQWSYDYKVANTQSAPFFATALIGDDIGHAILYPAKSNATSQWQTYSDLFQITSDVVPTDLALSLHPGTTSGSTFLADNIKVAPTKYVVGPEPGAYNSILYGGFEQGTLAPWTSTKPSQKLKIVSPGIMKEYALKWIIPNGQTNAAFGIQQDTYDKRTPVTEPGSAYLWNVDYTNNLPQGDGKRPMFNMLFEIFTGNDRTNITNIHNVYSSYHDGQVGTFRIPFQGQVNQFFFKMTITVLTKVPQKGNFSMIIDDISVKPLYTSSGS